MCPEMDLLRLDDTTGIVPGDIEQFLVERRFVGTHSLVENITSWSRS